MGGFGCPFSSSRHSADDLRGGQNWRRHALSPRRLFLPRRRRGRLLPSPRRARKGSSGAAAKRFPRSQERGKLPTGRHPWCLSGRSGSEPLRPQGRGGSRGHPGETRGGLGPARGFCVPRHQRMLLSGCNGRSLEVKANQRRAHSPS